jgi:hypothetical protein
MNTIIGPTPVSPLTILTASFTSSVTDCRRIHQVTYQLGGAASAGSLTGTLTVQGSADYQYSMPNAIQNTIGNGSWVPVTGVAVTSPTGSNTAVTVAQTPFPFLRCIFTSTSANTTGTLWLYATSLGQ